MDSVSRLNRILDHLRDTVAAVPDDAWDTPTNCEPWSASTLLNHALSSQLLWVQAITGEELVDLGAIMNPQPLEGDHLARTDEVVATAKETWASEGVLDRDITGAFGTLPGSTTIVFPSIDALCHSWDLATSVGIESELDDDLLAAGHALADLAINDQTRGFGLFAAEPDLADDASPTDRLMARTGRARRA